MIDPDKCPECGEYTEDCECPKPCDECGELDCECPPDEDTFYESHIDREMEREP